MTPRNNRESGIANRRRRVSQLHLKGLTAHEIVEELARVGVLNPATGKAYALRTIISDLVELQIDWIEQVAGNARILRGKLIAESREVRNKAWQNDDFDAVLRGIEIEASLYGLLQPPASLDNTRPQIRFAHHPISEYLCKLMRAGHGPDVTLEERTIAQEKYEDWVNYAQILLDRSKVEPELPILDANSDEES